MAMAAGPSQGGMPCGMGGLPGGGLPGGGMPGGGLPGGGMPGEGMPGGGMQGGCMQGGGGLPGGGGPGGCGPGAGMPGGGPAAGRGPGSGMPGGCMQGGMPGGGMPAGGQPGGCGSGALPGGHPGAFGPGYGGGIPGAPAPPPAAGPSRGEKSYVGCIMSFNQKSGFGFISCSETHALYGRDVFLPKSALGEFWMGDTVTFQVELDATGGMPKAKNLMPVPGSKGPGSSGAADGPGMAAGGGDGAPRPGGGAGGWNNAATSAPPWDGPLAVRPGGGAAPASPPSGGGPADEMMLQQMLLEQQQEKEQLMQLQMQVTQVVVQAAMAKQQAMEQEAMMQQQIALMQQPETAQQQQQLMQQQLQQQMQQQMMMGATGGFTTGGFMGPCGMGLTTPGVAHTGPNAAMAAQMAAMGGGNAQMPAPQPPPDFDMDKRYVGVIKSFNTAKGIGFVDCAEITEKFGCDVFLHASQILNDEEVGDVISFSVQLGRLGQPRAKEIQAIGSVQDPEMAALNKDPNQVYTGTVKSYNAEKGFGFIVCTETYAQFGSDVFLHKDQVKGIGVGDTVKFTLRLSLKGQPQAKDLEKADPVQRGAGMQAEASVVAPPAPPPFGGMPMPMTNVGPMLAAQCGSVPPQPPLFNFSAVPPPGAPLAGLPLPPQPPGVVLPPKGGLDMGKGGIVRPPAVVPPREQAAGPAGGMMWGDVAMRG